MIDSRYLKNMSTLSEREIKVLNSKKVCVVGCGGLGGYNIEILCRIGVENITIVDGDVFDTSNLNRQLNSNEKNIGKEKAEETYKRIKLINSKVKVNKVMDFMTEINAEKILAGHDVVVDCLDNIESRMLLEKTCEKLKIVFVHGSIAGFYGQVSSVYPGDKIVEKIYKNYNGTKGIEASIGNLPFIAGVIASIQASETVKILLEKGETLRRKMLLVDLLDNSFDTIEI